MQGCIRKFDCKLVCFHVRKTKKCGDVLGCRLYCGWNLSLTGSTVYIYHYKHRYGSLGDWFIEPLVTVSIKGLSLQRPGLRPGTHIFIFRIHHISAWYECKSRHYAFQPQHNILAVVNLIPPPRVTQVGLCQRCLFFTSELLLHQWDCLYLPACSLGSDSALYIRALGRGRHVGEGAWHPA